LAPGIGAAGGEKLETAFSAMARFSSWSIAEVTRRGDSARGRVSLFADGIKTEVVVPLSRVKNTWTVDSWMTVTTGLDFVPLER